MRINYQIQQPEVTGNHDKDNLGEVVGVKHLIGIGLREKENKWKLKIVSISNDCEEFQ